MTRSRLVIGSMRALDIPEVLELEADTLSAWSKKHLEDELRQPTGFQLVARSEVTDRIVAVIIGRIAADEAEILKISVAESARRKGVGYQLLDYAVKYSISRGVKNCFLELRGANQAARLLYEKRGFVPAGRRKDYYKDPVEDAILMRLAL